MLFRYMFMLLLYWLFHEKVSVRTFTPTLALLELSGQALFGFFFTVELFVKKVRFVCTSYFRGLLLLLQLQHHGGRGYSVTVTSELTQLTTAAALGLAAPVPCTGPGHLAQPVTVSSGATMWHVLACT